VSVLNLTLLIGVVPLHGSCMGSARKMFWDSGTVTFPYEQVLKMVLTEGLGPLVRKNASFTACNIVQARCQPS
jgi:hypothetical protein